MPGYDDSPEMNWAIRQAATEEIMTLSLFRINLKTQESQSIGHANSLADAAKKLLKLAKAEAKLLNSEAEVVRERDGYCVKIDPDRVAIYTFEVLPF